MRLQGKNILVTGGSSGIGLSLAEACMREGANVAFTYRSDDAIHRRTVVDMLGRHPGAKAIKANFTDPTVVEEVFEEALLAFGGLDVLINNAAAFSRAKLVDTDRNTINEVFNVNVVAPFLLISSFARQLIAVSRGGSIINISSLSATAARSEMAAYQSSKAALEMLSTSASYELAKYQIRSNIIAPGLTETESNEPQRLNQPEVWARRASSIPMGRPGKPADFMGAAVYLASDESKWVTGAKITIDGGANTF
jgi:NAD(P)-dependent dehydrogenase (short-subunit alcohol dehydrogenase family)